MVILFFAAIGYLTGGFLGAFLSVLVALFIMGLA